MRRSSAGASSRNAYGFAVRISWASGEGSFISRAISFLSPLSIDRRSCSRPRMSIASSRQSRIVCATSGCAGISIGPIRFSAQATWSGNTRASKSSAAIRCSCGATLLPLRQRGIASARVAFQRQRIANIGASSSACVNTSQTVFEFR